MTSPSDRHATYPPPTDFGRQMQSGTPETSLVLALRAHAARATAREAVNFQLIMGLVGFGAGLVAIVPLVLWLASARPQAPPAAPAPVMAGLVGAAPAAGRASPTAHLLATPAAPVGAPPLAPTQPDALDAARALIRSGDLLAARRMLSDGTLTDSGEAHFVLAETYDPNVLAALDIEGDLADAPLARHHYQAARDRGIAAAGKRLEALEIAP